MLEDNEEDKLFITEPGKLVQLIVDDFEYPENGIFCWYENKHKQDIDAHIFPIGTIGIYFGLWEFQTNGLTWHKVMVNY